MVTTTIYNHNGLSSSNKESDELNHEILENQFVQQTSSTPENIDEVPMIEGSDKGLSKEDLNYLHDSLPKFERMFSSSANIMVPFSFLS